MKNMSKMLQQAQQMQSKMTTLQNELATKEIKTTSGGGNDRPDHEWKKRNS